MAEATTAPKETLLAAFTAPGADFPPFINATDLGDGTVRITVRANPTPKQGIRVCAHSTRDPNYRVGLSCVAGGEGCNNYCNMHPNRRTKENPDGLPMADRAEPCAWTQCGETVSAVIPLTDWNTFVCEALRAANRWQTEG